MPLLEQRSLSASFLAVVAAIAVVTVVVNGVATRGGDVVIGALGGAVIADAATALAKGEADVDADCVLAKKLSSSCL